MNLVYIGIIALAVIAVGCLYFKIDGAILSSIVAIIAGAAGFGVQKAKEQIAPADIKIPTIVTNVDTKVDTLVPYAVPVKSPMVENTLSVDFNQIDKEILESIQAMGLDDSPQQECAMAMSRAVGARVKGLDEVFQWNRYLMRKALEAAASLFKIAKPDTKAALDKWVTEYVNVGCHPINDAQKVVLGWVSRLDGHAKALARLQVVGIDWDKLSQSYHTAWYIAELAWNPVVQIGITSEDVTS